MATWVGKWAVLAVLAIGFTAQAESDNLKIDRVDPVAVDPIQKVGPLDKVGPSTAAPAKPSTPPANTSKPAAKKGPGAIDITVPSDFVDVKTQREDSGSDSPSESSDSEVDSLNAAIFGGHKNSGGSDDNSSSGGGGGSPIPTFGSVNVMDAKIAGPTGSIVPPERAPLEFKSPEDFRRVEKNDKPSQDPKKDMPAGSSGSSGGC